MEITELSVLLEIRHMIEFIIAIIGLAFVWKVFKILCGWWSFIFGGI